MNSVVVLAAAVIFLLMAGLLMRSLYFHSVEKMDALGKEMEANLLLLTSDAIAASGEAEQKKTELRMMQMQVQMQGRSRRPIVLIPIAGQSEQLLVGPTPAADMN